ncbi:MAG: sensor histidine kinase [Deltaproteobacteria bacterium]|nr:MAG: sensor histidine kinase [Deltaproteobacteria bacterium]
MIAGAMAALAVGAGAMSGPGSGVTLAVVAGVAAASNLWLRRHAGRSPQRPQDALTAVLLLDVVLFSVLVAVSGGSTSPFSPLYVILVSIGALALPPVRAWTIFTATVVAYGAFFLVPGPTSMAHHGDPMRGHMAGMFVAYLLVGASILVAVTRVGSLRAEAHAHLQAAQEYEERNRRLAGLATLAAGAAHELRTPLSTILVIIRELERRARDSRDVADLRAVRDQVGRCQDVLAQLAGDAGLGLGEEAQRFDLVDLLDDLREDRRPPKVGLVIEADDIEVEVPGRLFLQVLRRLVENAVAASGPGQQVVVTARADGDVLGVEVADEGPGMPPDVLRRVGEPFFTTRSSGRGLGVYFVRSVMEQVGGAVELRSNPGEGTTATIRWPAAVVGQPATEASA